MRDLRERDENRQMMVELIEFWLMNGAKAHDIIARLEQEFGFSWTRPTGTERLSFRGVAATCTAGGDGLLRAWCNAARRKAGVA